MTEAVKLRCAYQRFLRREVLAIEHDVDSHMHPAPAWAALFEAMIGADENVELIDEDDVVIEVDSLITLMDMIARFASERAVAGQPYNSFSQCHCARITDEDIKKLLAQ